MKRINRILSLFIVLAMLSVMMFTAAADGEDFTLTASSDSVNVGDTVTITLAGADSVTANAASFYLHYDSTAFEFDEETGADFVVFNTNEVNDLKEEGLMFVVNDSKAENKTISAGTWGTFTFTAKKAVSNAPFTLEIVEVLRTREDGVSDEDISDNFTAGSTVVTVEAETIAVTGISLNKSTLSLIAGGETETLTATVEPENATDKTVTWSTNDPLVATVANGIVTPVAEGTAIITATAGDFSATCSVTVNSAGYIPVTSFALSKTEVTLTTIGATTNVSVKNITPAEATNQTITWTTDNPTVATVASRNATGGKITAVGVGKAKISATIDGVSVICSVTVKIGVTKVTLDQTSVSLRAGRTCTLHATVAPEDATYPEVTWESDNVNVATVDQDGVVTAVAPGRATITAEADGVHSNPSCTVNVSADVQGPYSVTMGSDTTADVGTTVNVPVTVSSTDEESFNAVDISFRFDPTHLTLLSTEIDDFTVDASNGANGTVRVFRYGDNKAVGQVFSLQFKVNSAGESTVTCTEAYVDKSANATTENVAAATIEDPETKITGRVYYTVTLAEGLSSDDNLNAVEAGGSVNFTVDGYSEYYTYEITATIGEESIPVTNNGSGSYTIENVNGNIEVTFTKTGIQSQVTIDGEDITGEYTATYGMDYVFTVTEEEGYSYEINVSIDDEPYTEFTGPDANGNYTIPGTALTGPISVTVTKTPIQNPTVYTVSFEGSGAADVPDKPTSGTKGESLTFTVNEAAGYEYTVTYSVDGGTAVALTGADGSYTIAGAATANVSGYVLITVEKVRVYNVTFVKNGPGTAPSTAQVTGATSVEASKAYTFTIKQHTVYSFTVKATIGGETYDLQTSTTLSTTNADTTASYTISADLINDDVQISISWKANEDYINLIVQPMVNVDGGTIYFIGAQARSNNLIWCDEYDGHKMFLATNKYTDLFSQLFEGMTFRSYAYLVYIPQGITLTREEVLTKLSFLNNNAGTLTNVTDVNESGLADINDAQLVYDIYKGHYSDFETVSMLKFFNADVNHDISINVTDAAAVVNSIA